MMSPNDSKRSEREQEAKILSAFLRKAAGDPKKFGPVSSMTTPTGETPSADQAQPAVEPMRLSPETAELVKRMTAPGRSVPFRSLCPAFEELVSSPESASVVPPPDESRPADFESVSVQNRVSEAETFVSIPKIEMSQVPSASDSEIEAPLPNKVQTDGYFDLDDLLPAEPDEESAVAPSDHMMVVSNLHKGYVKGKVLIPVLRGVNIDVRRGEYLSIVGQSGSGKSTLLHLMGTLDLPDSGSVHFEGQRIDNLPTAQRDFLRNRSIGMIFQFYHLIPEMTMIENVLAPLMIRESFWGYMKHRRVYHRRAKELLERVGLGHRIRHKPNELSGGEMQRTAIARALITEPRILLADEPTGNLDSRTSGEITNLLRSLNREKNLTIIMVTHDTAQAEQADRYIRLIDGQVAEIVQKG